MVKEMVKILVNFGKGRPVSMEISKEEYELLNEDAKAKDMTFQEYIVDIIKTFYERIKAREETLRTGKVVLPPPQYR
jgi:hypothetical protein